MHSTSPRMSAFCLLLIFSSVWSSPVSTAQDSDTDKVGLAAEVKRIFRTRCFECHGDTRRESDIHILDRSSFVGDDAAVVPGSIDGSYLYDLVASDDEDYRMPAAPRPPLNKGEIETVRKWINAGAPPFPDDVPQPDHDNADKSLSGMTGAEYVLSEITDYVEAAPREDRRFLRFFSSNHLLTAGATASELRENQQALAKAINHLSWQPDIVQPVVVDEEAKTIFAVDIRKLGWHETVFDAVNEDTRHTADSFDLFDLVLLEYPYGLIHEHSETFAHLDDVYLQPAKLIRPIPYVRIDWFVSVATQSPLYEDLLQLPHQLAELEDDLNVDGEGNLESFIARRAGMTLSGVSRNNRVVERHPALYGAYWKSYDFETSKGLQNMFVDPINFHYAGGEMIWNLPNGLQAYLVTDNTGRRISAAPTAIVTDKFAEDRVVRNGLACMRCHDRGMKRFADNIRPAIESLSGSAGLNKKDILRLYGPKEEMDKLLDRDQARFMAAMEKALGEPQTDEPLIPTSRGFLDAPLTLTQVASELGLRDSSGLKSVFRLPQFTRLGLSSLPSGGVIRRDTWEDYFDRVVRQLGTAVPVAPVDGLTRPDQLADRGLASGLQISTNKRSNVFAPGDEMVITVKNETDSTMFIELIGTSAFGRTVVLTDNVLTLNSGETFRFPDTGSIKIQPQLGTELITVFASPVKFDSGVLLRGKRAADRFVHNFYHYQADDSTVANEPAKLVKKTLKIQTR